MIGTYVVKEGGERLDRIARALYGTERGGTVELLLDINPGLAALGAHIPAGTEISVPERPQPKSAVDYVRPWE